MTNRSRDTTMRCVYCNAPCDDRPVRHEAMCWDCWRDEIGERNAEWRRVWEKQGYHPLVGPPLDRNASPALMRLRIARLEATVRTLHAEVGRLETELNSVGAER